ncbi:hypothetical protein SARC_10320 [Sphaeroforma arctica JP610]|uniref:F-box domain-containing protein n=1 Tax=Sphaeroforma arctica JP610 TaxID=667725 RepID=A0A0L0FKB1_9EUKA|nr:hypothetical protein SARC_10320 [Sphaeroforma arctica JP610]KNC77212.1 hypothetical protein SARC_10320 [Sphaeroforma arctica JP610]|eukprot:XP_014151114.1 hypothetical protein SARC_10320 [Sphaeroforma arctica JP610]
MSSSGDLLPPEILLRVFQWLPQVDLLQMSLVCQQWHIVAMDSTLWTHITWETELACRWMMVTLPHYQALLKRPQFCAMRKLKPPSRKGTCITLNIVRDLSESCPHIQTLDLSCWDAYATELHHFADIRSLRGVWFGSIKSESHAHLKLCEAMGTSMIDLRVRSISWHDTDALLKLLQKVSTSCVNVKILYAHVPLYNGLCGQVVAVLKRFTHLQVLSLCWREGTDSTHWQDIYEEIVQGCENNAFRELRTIVFTQRDYARLRKPLKRKLRKLGLLEVRNDPGTYPHLFPDAVLDYSQLSSN